MYTCVCLSDQNFVRSQKKHVKIGRARIIWWLLYTLIRLVIIAVTSPVSGIDIPVSKLASMSHWWPVWLLGILQNMVNPSLAPTQPEGSELPTISYGGEGIPRVLKQYRFSPYGYIFPIREVINPINPRDSYMHHWPWSPLTQVMA